MAKLSCSIIIVSYYTKAVLFECLESLLSEQNKNIDVEIIIVDNGNPDSVKQQLKRLQQQQNMLWLRGQGNIGFAAGCNLGVKNATGDIVLLLNPDCIAERGAVEQLCRFLEQHVVDNRRTLVSGWITNPDGSEQRGLRRNLLTPRSLFIERLPLLNRLPFLQPYRLNLIDQSHEATVMACSGACMMMFKALYQELNGMDEGYFLHVDDLDLCRRLHDRGGRVLIDENTVFSHHKGTSTAHQQRVAKHKRNGFLRYFAKHHRYFWYSPLGWGLRGIIHLNYWLSRK